VPDGLLSAEFPPMMVQTLVENAIKHGLEPKAEGGQLTVKAEIVHGKLQVTWPTPAWASAAPPRPAPAWAWPTSASGCSCCTARRPRLTVAENPGGGTVVTITVPYRSLGADAA
jgi:hypothetical protein